MARLFVRFYLSLALVVGLCVVTVLLTMPPIDHFPTANLALQTTAEAPGIIADQLSSATDPVARDQALEELSRRLEARVFIEPIARVKDQLFPLQLERMERGEPVVAPWAAGEVCLFVRVPDQPLVAVMALPGTSPVQRMRAMVLVVLVLGLGGAVLGNLVPLQRQLVNLSATASRIGGGELGARAEVRTRDAAGELATAFNAMAERVERLIERREELLRAVSHELRTPIARLGFAVEMLGDMDDLGERRRRVEEVHRDLKELDGLVGELLSYATLDEDARSLSVSSVDLAELLADLVGDARRLRPGLTVDLAVPSAHVQLDQRMFGRMITNLLSNAVRYTSTAVQVTAEVAGNQLTIHVDDDGPGVPDDERARIFEPLVRLDSARSRDTGGVGLGLSLARRIAVAHGGSLVVTASPLGGARFTIALARGGT